MKRGAHIWLGRHYPTTVLEVRYRATAIFGSENPGILCWRLVATSAKVLAVRCRRLCAADLKVGRYPYRWEIIIVCLVCLNENKADPEGFPSRFGESKVLKFKGVLQLQAAFA